MVLTLFDTNTRRNLYPLAQTHAIADLRCGIFTVKERWQLISGLPVFIHTAKYLSGLYEEVLEEEQILIDASLKDEDNLRSQILSLQPAQALQDDIGLIAGRTKNSFENFDQENYRDYFDEFIEVPGAARFTSPWQIVEWNDEQLRKDFLLLFSRSSTQTISQSNQIIQPENIIIEEGVTVEHCIINASAGPVYIGKNATIMEGSMLRGPLAVGENAVVKMGSKIYGATTIGPFCTVGGEMKNAVFQSCSNKAHDGYVGDAVIGNWCNLGAGTSNSNVKNTGGEINVIHPVNKQNYVARKCGMIMGDYSRTAINTSINSGSLIGICCNIFGEGLMPKQIENFSWGGKEYQTYEIEKAIQHADNWKKMKGEKLSNEEISVLRYIFERDNNETRFIKT